MNSKLEKQVEEQRRIIDYLQRKFKETTGRELEVPQTWEQFLDIPSEEAPIMPLEQQVAKRYEVEKAGTQLSFNQAVAGLNLPQKLQQVPRKGGKKKLNSTSFEPTNPFHMVEMINLSGYEFRKFSKARLKELLECIVDMRCLKCIVLQENGIGDPHLEELQELFCNKRLTRIDLSRNKIERASAQLIAKYLAANCSHIEWLDLSRNPFSRENGVVSSLLAAIKSQSRLFHLCMDVQENPQQTRVGGADHKELTNQLLRLLNSSKPPLSSLGVVDTRLGSSNLRLLESVLEAKDCTLTCLNLQYCFLDWAQVESLSGAFSNNKSLLKLDVSKNGLGSYSGILLARMLRDNIHLTEVLASYNMLGDEFAHVLADTLEVNFTLITFDIGNNPIGAAGAESLIRSLTDKNGSLESLGELAGNLEMGIINIEKIKKLLRGNCISAEFKQAQVRDLLVESEPLEFEGPDRRVAEAYESEYNDYTLLKPVVFTNPLQEDPFAFKLWNI